MGRQSKNKKRQASQNEQSNQNKQKRSKKKQKRERFWIEDCRDSSSAPSSSSNTAQPSLEVLITQCQLFDDYRQIPQQQLQSADINDEKNADTTVVTAALGSSQNLNVESENKIYQKTNEVTNTKAIVKAPEKGEGSGDDNQEKKSEERGEKYETKALKDNNECDFSDAFISIKRAKSALKATRVMGDSVENFEPLPNGDCGDGITNPYNNEEVPDKFWSQRRRLFTLYDQGIQLDKESWYSVTPEAIANHISAYLVGNRENAIIVDPFSGCGGNAIAFARMERVKLVVCVDKDLEKLKMAASNATIYNIPKEKMVFIHNNAGNVLSLYENRKLVNKPVDSKITKNEDRNETFKIGGLELLPDSIDCIFLSPPWGGMDYAKVGKRNYTLQCIRVDGVEENTEMDGEDVLNGAAKALGQGGPIALFLPKNINGVALGRSVLRAGYSGPLVLEKNVLNAKLKTVTAYIGL
jgi:trimethylguanosine synthase